MGKGTQVWPTVPIPISRHFLPLVAPATDPAGALTLSSGPWPPPGCSLPPGIRREQCSQGTALCIARKSSRFQGNLQPPPPPMLSMRPGHLSYFTVLHCVLGGPVSRTMPTRLCITRTTLSGPLAIQEVYVVRSRKSYKDSFPQYFAKVCCSLHTTDKLWTP